MKDATSTNTRRRMLFLSHATPEDNNFARWLALQLANEGYPVWCDLTKLLGGEDFWKDIQEAIREDSIRFLFVLSRHSNSKDGTLQELACAKSVASKLKSQIRDGDGNCAFRKMGRSDPMMIRSGRWRSAAATS